MQREAVTWGKKKGVGEGEAIGEVGKGFLTC